MDLLKSVTPRQARNQVILSSIALGTQVALTAVVRVPDPFDDLNRISGYGFILVAALFVAVSLLIWWRVTCRYNEMQQGTLANLRQHGIVGVLTLTGLPVWDRRLQQSMVLPAGVHLYVVDEHSE